MSKILTLFGTRPEVMKLAPVIRRFEEFPEAFETINVSSSQHTDLLRPFTHTFGVRIDHDLEVMRDKQSPDEVCARVLMSLKSILEEVRLDLIILQGDTTTAMAGALSGFTHRIPVAHVEAGGARLVGGNPETLAAMLEEIRQDDSWIERVRSTENPFGQGDSGTRIVAAIADLLGARNVHGASTSGTQ